MKFVFPLAIAGLLAVTAHAQTDAPVITRAPITTDDKTAASSADATEFADLRIQNKKLSTELAQAWKENDRLKTYAIGQIATANQKAGAAQDRADSATNTLKQNQADLDAKNKEVAGLNGQLANAQKAAANPAALAAVQHDLDAQTQKVADLEAERADLKQKLAQAQTAATAAPAATSSEPTGDLEKQVAATQDKLNMSLRAFTVLQNDDDQLKDNLAKTTDERDSLTAQLNDAKHLADERQTALNQQAQQMAGLQAAAATDANNISSLHDQLRQMQNLVAQLASENSQLKTRMVLNAPAPSGTTPDHYAPAPAPATPPPAETGPRTYKVASGDTLAKISKKFYGTSTHWQQILAANHAKLRDDKSLRVGMELTIP